MKPIGDMARTLLLTAAAILLATPTAAAAGSFWVTADQILKPADAERPPVLVDVRPAAKTAAVRIPGSIAMPLYVLRTKAFFKTRPFVLVDQGFDQRELAAECRKLRGEGFDARVLHGGLAAWQRAGGLLTGNRFERDKLSVIQPRDLHRASRHGAFLAVALGPEKTAEAERLLPGSIHVTFDGDPARLPAQLDRLPKDPGRDTVVITPEGSDFMAIGQAADTAGLARVFFLSGGLAAYKQYLSDLERSHRPRAQRLQGQPQCFPCRKAAGKSG